MDVWRQSGSWSRPRLMLKLGIRYVYMWQSCSAIATLFIGSIVWYGLPGGMVSLSFVIIKMCPKAHGFHWEYCVYYNHPHIDAALAMIVLKCCSHLYPLVAVGELLKVGMVAAMQQPSSNQKCDTTEYNVHAIYKVCIEMVTWRRIGKTKSTIQV